MRRGPWEAWWGWGFCFPHPLPHVPFPSIVRLLLTSACPPSESPDQEVVREPRHTCDQCPMRQVLLPAAEGIQANKTKVTDPQSLHSFWSIFTNIFSQKYTSKLYDVSMVRSALENNKQERSIECWVRVLPFWIGESQKASSESWRTLGSESWKNPRAEFSKQREQPVPRPWGARVFGSGTARRPV